MQMSVWVFIQLKGGETLYLYFDTELNLIV